MGAETFETKAKGTTAKAAFQSAVDEARYENGHGGYTGTIAEKNEFVMIDVPADRKGDVEGFVEELISEGDKRIDDKWGPAGCIDLGNNEYLFFGWASS